MKKCLFATCESGMASNLSLAGLRVFAGLTMAITHGWAKVPPPEMFVGGLTSMGFPMPEFFAWAASLSEFVGALLLAIGFLTRPAAFFLGITMFVAAFVAHGADPFARKELSLLYLFISLVFFFRGGGKFSIDNLIKV